jgi:hypothetical protein
MFGFRLLPTNSDLIIIKKLFRAANFSGAGGDEKLKIIFNWPNRKPNAWSKRRHCCMSPRRSTSVFPIYFRFLIFYWYLLPFPHLLFVSVYLLVVSVYLLVVSVYDIDVFAHNINV